MRLHEKRMKKLGVLVDTEYLVPVYVGICKGKDGCDFWVTTYILTYHLGDISMIRFNPGDGITIGSMDSTELTDHQISPFSAYNREVFMALKAMKD